MEQSFESLIRQAVTIRQQYHALEVSHHGTEWSLEEDALAFLTDAGLVGRLVMDKEGRWPKPNSEGELAYKISESIWWLINLAERSKIDLNTVLPEVFNTLENNTRPKK
ncbi:MazG-like protein [Macrococcus capreoli]|uniref:MazG-like protein n=1 Tax=Macrococcus capreoli TaxID=2982690 RepID=UPI0021D5D3B0|nr:MazG-like protein [Macrococcus sp. TMW 2.2395]MCU7557340.1 MazG-like protein [Macrococcus sp. TMW 2.2395]